ncbi:MAG: STM4014 family protein [Gemmataceae bacterium]
MNPRLVLVGNRGCRRVGFWNAAADRLGWPAPTLVPYRELLARPHALGEALVPDALVRVESPAGDWETFRGLLRHGIAPSARERFEVLDGRAIDATEYERGRIVHPRQAYLGWTRLLRELYGAATAAGVPWLHPVEDIADLFDKPRCQERLAAAGVPIPASFGPARDYADVKARCGGEGRVMIKLAHGSGAAGCVAIHRSNGRVRALTTVAEACVNGEARMYCSKRLRCIDDEGEIARIVDTLCRERVQVERWLPKASCGGRNFDLRVVVIGGVPRHAVVRTHAGVFTNLTLGGRRGDLQWVRERMGDDAWRALLATCSRAAAAFPESFTLGLDVLVRPDFRRHAVLEVNAFGDLLLGSTHRGEDTYTATLAAWAAARAPEVAAS